MLGGSCAHDPPAGFASPNGDTPLPDGGLLVTEIGGWIDRLDRRGRLVWSVRSPVAYPSDAQLLPNGRILVASFTVPGRIVELTPGGRVTWSFGAASGPDFLNKPSLAVRWPNGMIAANDDYGDRVIVIDPRTKRIVWQYGHTGVASSAPGYLSKPDGIDLLPAAVAPRARPGRRRPAGRDRVAPGRARRDAPGGDLAARGGRAARRAAARPRRPRRRLVLPRDPGRTARAARRPSAACPRRRTTTRRSGWDAPCTSSAAGRRARATPSSASRPAGDAARVGSLGEPLSDLGAAVVGRTAYVVGGYTGARFATGILAFRGGAPTLAARLPVGLRYAGVAALGGRVYVAGGVTTTGTSRAVYAFDPGSGRVSRVATLPAPVAHAPLVALGGALYLVGGDGRDTVLRIRPGGTVAVAGRLPAPLANAAAVALGGSIYVLGGDGSDAVLRVTPPR